MTSERVRKQIEGAFWVRLLPESMRDRFVDILLSVSKEDTVASGATLFKQGDTDTDRGCAFLEGARKVTRSDGEVKYLQAPEILGEVQLFMPQGERTATVEVVVGGPVLNFAWHDLGAEAQKRFSAEELVELREAIKHSVNVREPGLLDALQSERGEDAEGPGKD